MDLVLMMGCLPLRLANGPGADMDVHDTQSGVRAAEAAKRSARARQEHCFYDETDRPDLDWQNCGGEDISVAHRLGFDLDSPLDGIFMMVRLSSRFMRARFVLNGNKPGIILITRAER